MTARPPRSRTPIAKAVTKQVVEKKERAYSTTAKGSAPAKKAKPRER